MNRSPWRLRAVMRISNSPLTKNLTSSCGRTPLAPSISDFSVSWTRVPPDFSVTLSCQTEVLTPSHGETEGLHLCLADRACTRRFSLRWLGRRLTISREGPRCCHKRHADQAHDQSGLHALRS